VHVRAATQFASVALYLVIGIAIGTLVSLAASNASTPSGTRS
jgi:hypothetical protein